MADAVLWYILVRIWVLSFVPQDLIQAETTVNRKASTYSKGNKDDYKIENRTWIISYGHFPPHVVAV